MNAKTTKSNLVLTERALNDIAKIESYSIEEFGKRAANKCISEIEAAFVRFQENSELLRAEEDLHPELQFYRVNKHLLVCDVQQKAIFLLTVIHASRDIPSRLAEMQPSLTMEVELLHQKLVERNQR